MHALFSLEKQRNAASQSRERLEREAQLDKMRQLEEEILSQRQYAHAHPPEPRQRGVPFEQVREMRAEHAAELARIKAEHAALLEAANQAKDEANEQILDLRARLMAAESARDSANDALEALRKQMSEIAEQQTSTEANEAALTHQVATLRAENSRLTEQVFAGEQLRRKLHNQVQELRGNVRVYVRVRPGHGALASLAYPDTLGHTALEVRSTSESATGNQVTKTYPFTFDHVFGPDASQDDVFTEVSQLVQSVLDGYNTTIFAYGQTGSGKTHTLEGPEVLSAAEQGLIPRAMEMLWDVAARMRSQGWEYSFDAQMVQIYLDNIYDLLGDDGQQKHEIRHEGDRTVVTNVVTVPVEGPAHVHKLLATAKKRRAVAATLMNQRSSRSHSVFMLRVRGRCVTGEACDATLNLVDLAGSERLNTSGSAADPTRLREAQSINRSLSSLADVIGALGGGKHVPYRNSTLTWLLRNSLGGNSKTLMLLALSPMADHLGETLWQ
ncbi:kinesin-like nuclear fusion protein [Malassezia cuniculi]|uniref:Kinesin-like protein n=1 Tax=Malassezia cuniculi TaxID=948313 RepID=A0AAF0EQ27_9BASI|nr:kinesin-like nuclear fusion protein [Malassezia cuniculi]